MHHLLPYVVLIAEGFDINPFLNGGVAVAVLAFLLAKLEPRLRAIESAIDRSARAMLLLVVALGQASPVDKEQACAIIKEIDEKKGRE